MDKWIRGGYMKKEILIDVIAFLGIGLISVGFFKLNSIAGFIATGSMLVGVAFLISKGGD